MAKRHTPPTAGDAGGDPLAWALDRFRPSIERELRAVVARYNDDAAVGGMYGQIAYHLGWVDEELRPVALSPGKLLRPALALWACELAGAATGASDAARARRLDQALPVAASVELLHNFSLVHDDIEDRDEQRRHRRTLWAVWGEAQGINSGDAIFCLARLALWGAGARGIEPATLVRLATLLDRTSLRLCEGQHLDMSFEAHAGITPERYLAMIARKTAALMRCATEMGALVGAPGAPAVGDDLAAFGEALGVAFQLRDDLLGIWADSAELGKDPAGDLRRKKMSLPVIYALASATRATREELGAIYAQPGPASDGQIAAMFAALDATGARERCRATLAHWCGDARSALDRARGGSDDPSVIKTAGALGAMLEYVAKSS